MYTFKLTLNKKNGSGQAPTKQYRYLEARFFRLSIVMFNEKPRYVIECSRCSNCKW